MSVRELDGDSDTDHEFFAKHGWPCVIVADRYTGTYSGALWTAFALEEIPEGCRADDVTCQDFWCEMTDPVGKGSTPDEALADLNRAIAESAEALLRKVAE